MKGLLLKDFYVAKKYCRAYLLMSCVFIAASLTGIENMFFVFYPCFLFGMIPATLLSYDERSRWMQYSGTLPYTKAQLVSSKYLIGLITQAAAFVVVGITQAIRMQMSGTFRLDDFLVLMLMVFIMATIFSSLSLPIMFKLGVEKGRLTSYVMIGVLCGGSAAASGVYGADLYTKLQLDSILLILSIVGIGLYALSWYLSIRFFEKREIT